MPYRSLARRSQPLISALARARGAGMGGYWRWPYSQGAAGCQGWRGHRACGGVFPLSIRTGDSYHLSQLSSPTPRQRFAAGRSDNRRRTLRVLREPLSPSTARRNRSSEASRRPRTGVYWMGWAVSAYAEMLARIELRDRNVLTVPRQPRRNPDRVRAAPGGGGSRESWGETERNTVRASSPSPYRRRMGIPCY